MTRAAGPLAPTGPLDRVVLRALLARGGGRIARPVRAGYLAVAGRLADLAVAGLLVDAGGTPVLSGAGGRAAAAATRGLDRRLLAAVPDAGTYRALYDRRVVDVLRAHDDTVAELLADGTWVRVRRAPTRSARRYAEAVVPPPDLPARPGDDRARVLAELLAHAAGHPPVHVLPGRLDPDTGRWDAAPGTSGRHRCLGGVLAGLRLGLWAAHHRGPDAGW